MYVQFVDQVSYMFAFVMNAQADMSFVEMLTIVDEVEESWKLRRSKHTETTDATPEKSINWADDAADDEQEDDDADHGKGSEAKEGKRTLAGYETAFWGHVQKHYPNIWPSFQAFDFAKKLKRKLVAWEIWDTTVDYMNENCVYTAADLNHINVIRCMSEVASQLDKCTDYPEVIFVMLRLCVPTTDGVPWLIKQRGDVKSYVRGLMTEMRASKFFRLSNKPVVKTIQTKVTTKTGKTATKKPKAKAKQNPKACPSSSDSNSSRW